MTSSALTRWLKQGLARGECPLCRVAHKAEREYVWYFFDEYSTQDASLDLLRAAHGFCASHAEALKGIEVDGLKSTLGISETYEDTLKGLLEQLERLRPGDPFRSAPCPACAARDEEVAKNAGRLVALLREDDRSLQRFTSGPGLCVPHFEAVWEATAGDGDGARLLLDVQHRAVAGLVEDLGEHIRKQGAEAKGEEPGPEADSWQRAIWLTAGWPDDEAVLDAVDNAS
jgi:hypothetical protein